MKTLFKPNSQKLVDDAVKSLMCSLDKLDLAQGAITQQMSADEEEKRKIEERLADSKAAMGRAQRISDNLKKILE